MAAITEPRAAALPLTGGRPGASVRVHPIITGEMHAPRAYTDAPVGRLSSIKVAGKFLGPRGRWDWLPVPAFLIEHPTRRSASSFRRGGCSRTRSRW
jgi:N-acyl homoserine lactone hydrolase